MQHLHISMITCLWLPRFKSERMESPSDVEKHYFKNLFFYKGTKPHLSGSGTVFTKHLTKT